MSKITGSKGRGRNRNHGGKRSQGRGGNFDPNGGRNRGNAQQLLDKYTSLARDATQQGDRITAENYYQHADHYYRIINARNEQQAARTEQQGGRNENQRPQNNGGQAANYDTNTDQSTPGNKNASDNAAGADMAVKDVPIQTDENDAVEKGSASEEKKEAASKKPRRARAPNKTAKDAPAPEVTE
ncbi:MAG: DUF4167 domain-containing protein [Rhodospirillaceae bacterium]|nr:DUF4167 domain-containing protein [Rhodospirillaceae bacterium]